MSFVISLRHFLHFLFWRVWGSYRGIDFYLNIYISIRVYVKHPCTYCMFCIYIDCNDFIILNTFISFQVTMGRRPARWYGYMTCAINSIDSTLLHLMQYRKLQVSYAASAKCISYRDSRLSCYIYYFIIYCTMLWQQKTMTTNCFKRKTMKRVTNHPS